MSAVTSLIAANAALWIILGLYMAHVAMAQNKLEMRIRQLEAEHD